MNCYNWIFASKDHVDQPEDSRSVGFVRIRVSIPWGTSSQRLWCLAESSTLPTAMKPRRSWKPPTVRRMAWLDALDHSCEPWMLKRWNQNSIPHSPLKQRVKTSLEKNGCFPNCLSKTEASLGVWMPRKAMICFWSLWSRFWRTGSHFAAMAFWCPGCPFDSKWLRVSVCVRFYKLEKSVLQWSSVSLSNCFTFDGMASWSSAWLLRIPRCRWWSWVPDELIWWPRRRPIWWAWG